MEQPSLPALTLSQQFTLTQIEKTAKTADRTDLERLLIDTVRQMMMQKNLVAQLLKRDLTGLL